MPIALPLSPAEGQTYEYGSRRWVYTSGKWKLAETLVYTEGNQTIAGNKTFSGTVGGITKAMVGLGNADNTSDANKPVSTAQQTALDAKAPLDNPNFTGVVSVAGDVNATSFGGGQLAGFRNKTINGKMEVAQRGTSLTGTGMVIDRWALGASSAATITVSQSSDNPTGEFIYSLRATVDAADTVIDAGDYVGIAQTIEGFLARDLISRTFTISFWARSPKTGVHCVSLRNSGADRSYVAEYTINTANTWEKKSISVQAGLITAGTWAWTEGAGLRLWFMMAAGSNWHTTAGSWQTGNFLATANQVNVLDTVGNIFAITGVQLEVSPVATPFEHRPYGMELALCQRYYQFHNEVLVSGYNGAGASVFIDFSLPVGMRVGPTASITAGAGGNSNANTAILNSAEKTHIRLQTTISATGSGYSVVDVALNSEF